MAEERRRCVAAGRGTPAVHGRKLEPLPAADVSHPPDIAALRHMARARAHRKIVIEAADLADDGRTLRLPKDGTYLVTAAWAVWV